MEGILPRLSAPKVLRVLPWEHVIILSYEWRGGLGATCSLLRFKNRLQVVTGLDAWEEVAWSWLQCCDLEMQMAVG